MNQNHSSSAPHFPFLHCLAAFALIVPQLTFAQIPVPATGCYHAAFTPNTQEAFESLAGKSIAFEMIFRSWKGSRTFDKTACDQIVAKGAYPYIAWEPWDNNINSTVYSLQSIIDGTHDALIRQWANGIKQWNKPLLLRWAHEMNGTWYPWDGFHNGGKTLTGYGSPAKPDGPERYIDAYRHVYHIFDSIGVTNVSWVWCPNTMWDASDPLNVVDNYYPGDDVVDWIGMNCYNWGTVTPPGNGWKTCEQMFRLTYDNVIKLADKPILVGESASTELGGDKAAWITATFATLKTAFPKIKLFSWFNIDKETDWRINSSPASLEAYCKAIADPYFLQAIVTTATLVSRTTDREFSVIQRGKRIVLNLPPQQSTTVELFAPQGRTIAVFNGAGATEVIDCTGYVAGAYLIRVTGESGRHCRRVIITR
jgi:hypothetical protein